MKILLINPPIREWAKPNVLPLGLGYVASVLRNNGYEVEVLDVNAHRFGREEVEEKIKNSDADVFGIGALVTVYRYVKWLISTIRKHHPHSKIVIGGSVGTSLPHVILSKTDADIVCIGEGEITALEIMNALRDGTNLSAVDGIHYRDESGTVRINRARGAIKDLDTLPLPAWDLFPMDIYLKNPVGAPNRNKWVDGGTDDNAILSMNLLASRGCPYKCIYCYHDFMGVKWRHRSPQNIIAEMKILREKYDVPYFHFLDDEFCVNIKFVFDFCKAVKEEFGNTATWGCSGRVNLMTEELISTMADAGCVLIGYGIESGSQRMLDIMKKNATVEQAKNAINLTRKYLGWADCSFMIGTPGENMETIMETVKFCRETELAPEVIFFATPYPGTDLYRMALAQGKIKDEEEYALGLGEQGEKIRVNFSELPDDELFRVQEWMVKELNAWNKIKHS